MKKKLPNALTLAIGTSIILLCYLSNSQPLQAQNFKNQGFYNEGCEAAFEFICKPKQEAKKHHGWAPPKNLMEAEDLMDNMLEAVFKKRDFKIMICHDVDNCFAQHYKNEDYIVIDPDFLSPIQNYNFTNNRLPKNTPPDWVAISILAHEIGHIENNHTRQDEMSIEDVELEADRFAGYLLCHLGATLEQAQRAMYHERVPERSVDGYPTRKQRTVFALISISRAIYARSLI